jgi:hypothetical protein
MVMLLARIGDPHSLSRVVLTAVVAAFTQQDTGASGERFQLRQSRADDWRVIEM